jgi:D-proline reductase (dithiol) PrdB
MCKPIDSYRFLDFVTRKMVKAWIAKEPSRPIPWTPLPRAVEECSVAVISSGGIALKGDRPFDQEGERKNPWWGDPTHRVLPKDTRGDDVEFYHLHVDPSFAREDLNCLLPLDHLAAFEEEGVIGRSAENHYSFMGYILDPTELVEETTPKIIEGLRNDQVDLVLLVPT